jgi:ribonucleoside-diphosphate reductase alpha chain
VADRLAQLREHAVRTNQQMADLLGVPRSAAVTCNKPSGNSSQLLDCASGIHARYAPYYIRRIQLAARTPLSRHLQAKGLTPVPYNGPTLDAASIWSFAFPVAVAPGAITRNQLTATDQLQIWAMWKQAWTEHNPSCTIYVRPTEWEDVRAFLTTQWQVVGGLSFLPKDDHIYVNAPYQEITAEEYAVLAAQLPERLDLWQIQEVYDMTTVNQEYACVGGICEI